MFPERSAVQISFSLSLCVSLSLSTSSSSSPSSSLLFLFFILWLFLYLCLVLLHCGCHSNKEKSMSAVMFCGLRRDVGANSVGECWNPWGGNSFNEQTAVFSFELLIYWCYALVFVAAMKLQQPKITCQSNIAWTLCGILLLRSEVEVSVGGALFSAQLFVFIFLFLMYVLCFVLFSATKTIIAFRNMRHVTFLPSFYPGKCMHWCLWWFNIHLL